MQWDPDCTANPCTCPGTEVGTPPPDDAVIDDSGITVLRGGKPIIRLGGEAPAVTFRRDRDGGLLVWVGPTHQATADDLEMGYSEELPPTIAFTREQANEAVMTMLQGPLGPQGPMGPMGVQATVPCGHPIDRIDRDARCKDCGEAL